MAMQEENATNHGITLNWGVDLATGIRKREGMKMNIDDAERDSIRAQYRFEIICACVGWDLETRQIIRALLLAGHGAEMSAPEISRETKVPPATVKRRVAALIRPGILERGQSAVFLTRKGRVTTMSAHREFLKIAAGRKTGLSDPLSDMLRASGLVSQAQIDRVARLQFARDLPNIVAMKIW